MEDETGELGFEDSVEIGRCWVGAFQAGEEGAVSQEGARHAG